MSHETHHSAEPTSEKVKIASSSSFWLIVIIAGLFIGALNFIPAMSEKEEGEKKEAKVEKAEGGEAAKAEGEKKEGEKKEAEAPKTTEENKAEAPKAENKEGAEHH